MIETQPPRDQLAENGFSTAELSNIREAIKNKYQGVATSAEGMFRYLTGKAGALQLGYNESLIADIPEGLVKSFCGVGNPFTIKDIFPGSCLLDIGCGAGFDLIVARRIVGDTGRVAGIDMTVEMLKMAGRNLTEMGIDDVETRLVESEEIPYGDNTFDVVISNGVINLSPLKLDLLKEIFRVLRPGGRLQFADIVLDKELPPMLANSVESWVQ
ncbi:Methyltransferase domain-containing protein [Desulfopila aestuarii DSM 18488]|uniref:Arsenite methyltransferase n=2 Tax=Desulfopila aestuarii TaxID=231440 RepID=A0A1M7YBS0_9BACT|nr:methyltransferase domain-containing protein [Desulfopila aestuarii]SHO50019.1 Methyltransferase domain-containing protein [Desulfopila aestuarii DSM 18488]